MAEYKIVSHKSAKGTEDEVNACLIEQWTLHGDLKVTDNAYVQAMVKHGDYEGSNDVNVYLQNQDNLEDVIRSMGDDIENGLVAVARALGSRDSS